MNPEEVNNAREEVLKELLLRKKQQKKDWNRNVLSVRTNDELAAKIKVYCDKNKISLNQFLNILLTKFFN
tara:strand:+ start:301 stop:510 length:210 start_codon:yes stop_codon:yes gene_type:complete